MKKLLALTVLATLMVAAGYSKASATRSACSERSVRILQRGGAKQLHTFRIEAKAPKDPQVGDTVRIPVVVTRPAEEDPLGQGIPMASPRPEAAPGVNVSVGLWIGEVFLLGGAVTDDEGKATAKIHIEKHVKPGSVDVGFHAFKAHVDVKCLDLGEDGYRLYRNFFSVKSTP